MRETDLSVVTDG